MRSRTADGVRYLTFDRPDVYNAFSGDVARELAAELTDLDPTAIDAVVLTGEGDAFSTGGDIEAMAERDEMASEAYERFETRSAGSPMASSRRRFPSSRK
jgi:enoyl-CoA hydratase/carnithine racemase